MVKKQIIVILSIGFLYSALFAGEQLLTVHVAETKGQLNYGSTGFLYGLGDPGIPAPQMLMALRPITAAQKPPAGLQHPNGDAFAVAPEFFAAGGKEMQIYAQDCYRQWPYEKLGMGDYLPKLETMVKESLTQPDKEKFVWIPLNEPDVIWYNDSYLLKDFCKDWESCYRAIKKIDPTARVGGPNTTRYSESFFLCFLTYAKEHDCLPDVITWHELQNDFFTSWNKHYESYRVIEKKGGVTELPITINEYARISGDLAMPGKLIQFISRFEQSQVNGCLAYWTTAGSLNDLVTGNSCATGAWWLYKWYGELSGSRIAVDGEASDGEGLRALAVRNEVQKEVRIICGGTSEDIALTLDDVAAIGLGDTVHVSVYEVGSSNLSPSIGPVCVIDEDRTVESGGIHVAILNSDENNAYLIVVEQKRNPYRAGEIAVCKTRSAQEGRVAFSAPEDGFYKMEFSTNGSSTNQKMKLQLNGEALVTLAEKDGIVEPVTIFLGKGINLFTMDDTTVETVTVRSTSGTVSVFEAESAGDGEPLAKGISIKTDTNASGGKVVSFDKRGRNVVLTMKIQCSEAGFYKAALRYANGELGLGAANYNTNIVDRNAMVMVNKAEPVRYFFRNTLGWSKYATLVVPLHLLAGENTISLYSEKGYAPVLDSIAVARAVIEKEIDDGAERNEAPLVEAEKTKAVVFPEQLSLSVRVRDDDTEKEKLSFEWKKEKGPGDATFTRSNMMKTEVTVTKSGSYTFSCTVGDGQNKTAVIIPAIVKAPGTYEAEARANVLSGTAQISQAVNASGGKVVGYIGNGVGNVLTFNELSVPADGIYTVTVTYISGENRTADLRANGEEAIAVSFPSSGSWTTVATVQTKVLLKKGMNSIAFSNATYYAPDIDCISIDK